jgi:hypothetical protein
VVPAVANVQSAFALVVVDNPQTISSTTYNVIYKTNTGGITASLTNGSIIVDEIMT